MRAVRSTIGWCYEHGRDEQGSPATHQSHHRRPGARGRRGRPHPAHRAAPARRDRRAVLDDRRARGRSFTPPRKTTLSPWTVAHRSTIYAPNRILTPLRRKDFDPDGERNIDKRGESGYEPISWDEALDIVAAEIVRIKREVGPAGMLTTPGSHHMWGNVGYRFSAYNRFMNLVGYTYGEHNPDSWEGWQWGGAHMWGFAHRLGIPEQYDLLEDALKHTEMMVLLVRRTPRRPAACTAPSRAPRAASGSRSSGSRCTSSTRTTARRPSSSPTSGWRRARAPTWRWASPSRTPGSPRAPTTRSTSPTARTGSASGRTTCSAGATTSPRRRSGRRPSPASRPGRSAPSRASGARKKTMLAAGGMGGWGGACRASSGNEWARVMIALAAMQGLGKPGSNIWSTTSGVPFDPDVLLPRLRRGRHLRRHGRHGRRQEAGQPHVAGRRHLQQPAALARGADGAAAAHPRGDAARAPRLARQGLLRLVHRGAVPGVPLPGQPATRTCRCTTATAARSSAR